LGLEPGTDLKSLFRQAIGVPQGTFTAIFLEGATERKVAFDRLLKVEEYRQAAEKLRDTGRFIDNSIADVREKIARVEGELARSSFVETEHETVAAHLETIAVEIEKLQVDLTEKKARVDVLDQQERGLVDLRSSLEASRSNKEKEEITAHQAEAAFSRSQDAAEKIGRAKTDNERHIAALERLSDLESKRKRRDQLASELAKMESAAVKVRAEQKRLDIELKKVEAAKAEIETLRLKAADQSALETQLNELRDRIAGARVAEERVQSIERELGGKREMFRVNKDAIKASKPSSSSASSLADLEKQEIEMIDELARLRTNLERDERFQSEISGGLCPILSQKCLNLNPNETLEDFLSNQFLDVKTKIAEIEKRRETIAGEIRSHREYQRLQAALESYENREKEILQEADELKEKKATLETERQQLREYEQQFAQLESKLKRLADPAARIRVLERDIALEGDIRTALGDVESNLERIESDKKLLDERVDEYRDFDPTWASFIAERDATAGAHRIFVANESEAAMFETRKKELNDAKERVNQAASGIRAAEEVFQRSGGNYDAERHKLEKDQLLVAERGFAERQATFDATDRRKVQLAAELKHFAEIRRSMQSEFKEKERLELVGQATSFIRDTLKEAAPRVARNYVYHISLEANQMFREITGHAEGTLKWAEDYSIILEEEGYERPFQSLSGGEQMAAALSVRLALLKQLTDIRIAFFDEPTTNMDAERRENLAMQLSRITHFDQLFVISHDETFDSYVDSVVSVKRAENE
ncbi:MAG: SMC family ATPase, partial [Acidobacteriota bacterium]